MNLTDRWIWITGASSGIGLALAEQLLKQGNRLIVTSRSRDNLEQLFALNPDNVWIVVSDISNPLSARDLKKKLAQITPVIDTVILNAGNCEYIDVNNFDIDSLERVTQVNYLGFARCVYAVLPLLLKSQKKPHLVGISSASAYFGLPRAEAYGASKAALSHFLDSLRVDLHHKGVLVSTVYPGFVDTPLTRKNDFPMPGIVSTEKATAIILSGMGKMRNQISFPFLLTVSLKFLRLIPYSWSTRLVQGMVRQNNPETKLGTRKA
jgi:short-subunit dehydrogenase